jgi:CheY-like chemotaxis protein
MNQAENPPRILLAEDTEVGRKVVARMLTAAGYQVTSVADGQAVIELLSGSPFGLVLMDCMMPGMDGFQAARAIRSGEAGQDNAGIPIVALTGLVSEADQEKCQEAGMDGYVQKPVEPGVLLETVDTMLKNREAGVWAEAKRQLKVEEEGLLSSLDAWSPGFMDDIIGQFLDEVTKDIAELQAGLEREDLDALCSIAHRLRGSAGILSARSLGKRAMALERAAAAHNLALARQLAPSLIHELKHMASVLRED